MEKPITYKPPCLLPQSLGTSHAGNLFFDNFILKKLFIRFVNIVYLIVLKSNVRLKLESSIGCKIKPKPKITCSHQALALRVFLTVWVILLMYLAYLVYKSLIRIEWLSAKWARNFASRNSDTLKMALPHISLLKRWNSHCAPLLFMVSNNRIVIVL